MNIKGCSHYVSKQEISKSFRTIHSIRHSFNFQTSKIVFNANYNSELDFLKTKKLAIYINNYAFTNEKSDYIMLSAALKFQFKYVTFLILSLLLIFPILVFPSYFSTLFCLFISF